MRNFVPTKARLQGKGINIDDACPVCGNVEILGMCLCLVQRLGLFGSKVGGMSLGTNLQQFLARLINDIDTVTARCYLTLFWSIWFAS